MASKGELVEQIKGIQRSDPEAKQGWWDYCDQNLGGVKDPNRHDPGVLQEFMNLYNSGGAAALGVTPSARRTTPRANTAQQGYGYQPSPAGWGYAQQGSWGMPAAAAWGGQGGGTGGHLSEMVKTGQRHSEAWKSAWRNYCAVQGTGKFDPTKYDDDFISGFVNYCGELACSAMGIQPGDSPPGDGGCGGTKRAMPSSAMGQGPPAKRAAIGGADDEKTELVNKIKALQRSDPDAKSAWWQFCDESMQGIKDPNRHEKDTLQQFLMSYS